LLGVCVFDRLSHVQQLILTGTPQQPVLSRRDPSRNTGTLVMKAAPSKTQEQKSVSQDEEKLIADQQRSVHNEKAQRAREEFEIARQLQIKSARTATGLCTMCGRQRGLFERLTGKLTHPRCKVFIY